MTTLAEQSRAKLAASLVELRDKRDRYQSGTEKYAEIQRQIDPLQLDHDAIVKRYFESDAK